LGAALNRRANKCTSLGAKPAGPIFTGPLSAPPPCAIWAEKPETANRLRGRIESVLDWATVRGDRQVENPPRWRGHLDKLLPARSKVRKTEHHSALPYGELPAFMKMLRQQEGVAAPSAIPLSRMVG
jgi:hypothetical protein